MDERAVGRRRQRDGGAAREGDDAHLELLRHLGDERLGGRLGGAEPRGLDVVRPHRVGDVDGEDDRRLLARDLDRRVRPRDADDQRGERDAAARRRAGGAGFPAARSTTFGSSAGLAKRAASEARRRSRRMYPTTSRGTISRPSSQSGDWKLTGASCVRKTASERSQSPEVERTTWRTPSERERPGEAAPLLGGGGGEPGAELRVPRVDAELPAGLGVDEPELTGIRQLLLARVADLDGEDVVAAGELEHRPAPVERAAEVGDDDDERPLARDRPGPGQRLAERRGPDRRASASSSPRRAASSPTRPTRPWRGGIVRGLGVAERDDAEPVAAAGRDVADRDRDALRHVGLAAVGGAEPHRRRRVEHEPGGQDALGDVHAHVRLAGPGGHVPVDPADVVAVGVRPDLRELGAVALERRAVVAGEQALHLAADVDVERAQERDRHRPGAGPVGRRSPRQGPRRAHAALVLARSTCGAGTAARTESRMLSGLTSSASAW